VVKMWNPITFALNLFKKPKLIPEIQYTLFQDIAKGEKGTLRVKQVQEWLCLNDFWLKVDDDFGPATKEVVVRFQKKNNLPATGVVSLETWLALCKPAIEASTLYTRDEIAKFIGHNPEWWEIVVFYAARHILSKPREIGGQNMGPWVRLYTGGSEGGAWAWCALYAKYVLEQAYKTIGLPAPLELSGSCDFIANSAKKAKRFRTYKDAVPKGGLFLRRKKKNDWDHTGIVMGVDYEKMLMDTAEGNTNAAGSREGDGAYFKVRAVTEAMDFVLTEP